ncbi:hypothetical protein A3K73_07235 [Candidatus Pacearchaeota archaeon RBG_13_36_9]|nr:MAG: hypothetical protein A3K73_07235 [Candidatus Pacearchaeota archaeon RBG_13_36_9]
MLVKMKKTAIIVGASADIGIKIVESLKKRDWNVYGTCNKNKEKLERQLDKSNIFKINLNSENSRRELEEMVIGIWRREKRVDAGVYVAGLWNPFFKFIDEDEDKIKEMWNVNYHGAYWFFRALVPCMIQIKNGSFVSISSTAWTKGSPHAETYGATKAALANLMISLSEELANYGIRANIVSPGPTNTKAFRQYYPNDMDVSEIIKNIPINKLAEPENIANCVAYLIEDKYVTRQNIILDGASMF